VALPATVSEVVFAPAVTQRQGLADYRNFSRIRDNIGKRMPRFAKIGSKLGS
jgi:hypothetical protein